MVSSLADLCVKSLCRTGYEHSPTGISFPLPSIAESILLDSSSPRRLPIPIANALFEGLARRRKLTEKILRVFLDPTRAMLTSLPLTFLRSMPLGGERSFEHRIRQRKFLRHVDVSFSNWISEHPFSLVDAFARTCRDTLLSFSASHVTGHLGVLRLKEFTRLRHVDLGYTLTSSTDIESLCSSLSQLRHLDVSGTTASWYQVFCSVKSLSELEHLGMSDLKFLTANEWGIVSRRNVSATWITDLFSTMTRLSSLDISNVKWDALQRSVLEATFRQIVTGAQSLTRLEASVPDLDEVVAELESSDRLEQMTYLAFHGEATWIPNVLSNGRLRFICCSHRNAKNIDFVNVSLKGGTDFRIVAMTLPYLVVESRMNAMDRRDVLLRVLSAAVTVARLKLFFAANDHSPPIEWFLVNVICLRTPYRTRCFACLTRIPGCSSHACPDHFSDPSVNELWEEMIESLLEASLTRPEVFFRTYNNLVWALCAALLSRPPVLSVALPFLLNAITREGAATRNLLTTCGSCTDRTPILAGLTSIFESLDEFERFAFVLHTEWLARVCNQVEQISSQGDLSCNDKLSPPLNGDICLFLDILYYMCRDLPDVQQRLVQETNLLALLPSYVPPLWKECRIEVSKSAATSSLRLLISLAENESLRHRVLSASSLQMLLDCSPCFESSYLTCLLLLCEDAHWPANVLSKDATAHRMVTLRFGILMSLEGDIQRYRYSNGTCACLRDMGQRTDVPSPVGWFGKYVLSMMEEEVAQELDCV